MEYHLKKTPWQRVDEWERRQLLFSGLDSSFLGKHDGLLDSKAVD